MWNTSKSKKDLDSTISKILPKDKSWDSNLEVWGDTESSDIHLGLKMKKK